MLKRKSAEQWIAEQRKKYPHFDREIRHIDRIHGPRRKLDFLADECLEDVFVFQIRRLNFVRITRPRRGLDDEALWRLARQQRMVILTGDDSDFWNDRKFPVQASPGVIIVQGRGAVEKARAFARLLAEWDLVKNHRQQGIRYFVGTKIKATPEGVYGKLADGGEVITF